MLLWNRDLSGAKFGKAINKSLANIMKGTMLIDPRGSCTYRMSHQPQLV
jgi:hypothetical protein